MRPRADARTGDGNLRGRARCNCARARARFGVSDGNIKVALSVRNAHPHPMAKTWMSKDDSKSAKAFSKAMRLLIPKNGRRQKSRPR